HQRIERKCYGGEQYHDAHVIDDLGKDDGLGADDRVIVKLSAFPFLREAFVDRIDGREEHDNPEQYVPSAGLRRLECLIAYENRGYDIQEDTVDGRLRPPFQQDVFVDQRLYFLSQAHGRKDTI